MALQLLSGSVLMPQRNYGYEKRQKELNKQRKQEEKRQRKLDRRAAPAHEQDASVGEATAGDAAPESESA
jgi:hypothetical protein